jgi:hypothetical protein
LETIFGHFADGDVGFIKTTDGELLLNLVRLAVSKNNERFQ